MVFFVTSKYDVLETGTVSYDDTKSLSDYLLASEGIRDTTFNPRMDVNGDGLINSTDSALIRLNALKFPERQSGSNTASASVNAWKTITFVTEMVNIPNVTITASGYNSGGSLPTDSPVFRLADISKTGFKISCNIVSKAFNYIAIF